MPTSIVIAEDHALFRSGLRQLLSLHEDMQVIGEAGDGLVAVTEVLRLKPDLLLLDLSMPGRDGLEVIHHVRQALPALRILVISMHGTSVHLRAAFKAGANGYLLKTADSDEFLFAIQTVLRGNRYISSELTDTVVDSYLNGTPTEHTSPLDQLTGREREILKLVAEGHSNKQIALTLTISEKTVDSHRTSFMRKLALRNIREVTMFAIRHGLVQIRELPCSLEQASS